MRYGTRTQLKRRWTPQGHRPLCPVRIGYEFGYLYTALCPYNGDLFCLLLPNMTKDCFTLFLEAFDRHTQGRFVKMFLDGASSHQEVEELPIELVKLPTAAPELNPVERFFKELRKELANTVFTSLEQVEQRIEQILKVYFERPGKICSLTLFSYLNPYNQFEGIQNTST